jgi:PAS domain S-box-containing protein
MKISFEKKILLGFIINLLVVIASGWIFVSRLDKERIKKMDSLLDLIELSLFVVSMVLLIIVYFIIRSQIRSINKSQHELLENKKLLQSIIDNTSNPIFIKGINGQYLLINKQHETLFHHSIQEIVGKTDYDLLPKEVADVYRNSDLEAVKALKEIKIEETIQQEDGPHTYIAVKFPLYDAEGRIYAIGGISTDITERKKQEESSLAADKFFNMSLDMMIIASDKFIKINPSVTKTLGYSEQELFGKPFLDFVYPEDVEKTLKEVAKLNTGALTINFENRYMCKDGSLKWILWSTSPDTATGLLYAVARDITQMKNDTEKLNLYTKKVEEDERQIQAIFEGAPDPVFLIDSENKIARWNLKAEVVFGWTKNEVLGKFLYDFIIPPKNKEAQIKELEQYLLTGDGPILNQKPYKMEALNKQGKEFPISLSVNPLKLNDKLFFIGFVRDITEIIQLENEQQAINNELYENEEKLRLIVDNIGEGVIVANADKKIVLANDMANEFFGIKEDDKIAPNFTNHFEVYFPDQKTVFPLQNLPMERAFKGEVTDDIDVVLWNPEKQEKKRVLLSGRPLIDQNDKVVAAVVTIKDISKYKQLEEELKETESKYRQLIGFKSGESKEV